MSDDLFANIEEYLNQQVDGSGKLSIEEVKEKKWQVEKMIADILLHFSKETGARVENVDLRLVESFGDPFVAYLVETKVTI